MQILSHVTVDRNHQHQLTYSHGIIAPVSPQALCLLAASCRVSTRKSEFDAASQLSIRTVSEIVTWKLNHLPIRTPIDPIHSPLPHLAPRFITSPSAVETTTAAAASAPNRPPSFRTAFPTTPPYIPPDMKLNSFQRMLYPFTPRQTEFPFLLLKHFPRLKDDLRIIKWA